VLGLIEVRIFINQAHKNLVEEAAETAVAVYTLEQPAFGKVCVSNKFRKRLPSLERHVAGTGPVLTEAQVQALEKKQENDVVFGEIETAWMALSWCHIFYAVMAITVVIPVNKIQHPLACLVKTFKGNLYSGVNWNQN